MRIGAGPHVPAGLGGDDQFVAMGGEVLRQDSAEVLLRRAEGRAVVVGKVEMGDAAVEGPANDRAPGFEGILAAEILPEPEGDGRQLQAGSAAAAEIATL